MNDYECSDVDLTQEIRSRLAKKRADQFLPISTIVRRKKRNSPLEKLAIRRAVIATGRALWERINADDRR